MGKEYTIWTSDPDYEEYRHDLEEDLPDFTEEERIAIFRQANYDSLEVQKNEMTVKFGMPILIVAQLGLWDGQHMAYKQIDSGNLADCFEGSRDTLNIRWYVDDRGDLRCDDYHHDGVNHYLYRVIRNGTPKRQIDELKDAIYNGTARREDLEACTDRLGDAIGNIYWVDVPGQEKQTERGEAR